MEKSNRLSSLMTIVATLAVLYVLASLALFVFQERLVFLPSADIFQTPAEGGLTYEEHYFETANGNLLHGWFVPASSGESTVTILFCHGNAGNIAGRVGLLQMFESLGYNIFIFDYQGYGLSEGSAGEQQVLDDGVAAWDFLTGELNIPADSILPVGRSMGGAVASYIAQERNPRALAVESTFTSIPDMARQTYRIFPVGLLARIQLPTQSFIEAYGGPVLIAHSNDDRLVPIQMGRKLYEAAGPGKQWLDLSGDHNEGYFATGVSYGQTYQEFITTHFSELSAAQD